MNKERIMSKMAFEACVSLPALLILFELFEERPLTEKVARMIGAGVVAGVGLILAKRVCEESYNRGFRVNRTWPDGEEPIVKK